MTDNIMANSPDHALSREGTPLSSLTQKRALEDDHQPAVSSPLNPDFSKIKEEAPMARERAARAKKESYKKRESKGPTLVAESRATPDSKIPSKNKKPSNVLAPVRWKLPPPRATDFEAPNGPTFTPHHVITSPDGGQIQFHETSEQ
jgi:COMPASS component BRE2